MISFWQRLKKHNQIFISYASKDRVAVYEYHQRLQRRGYNVWLDREHDSILPGAAWPDTLKAEVEASYAIICFLSPDYLTSEWCQKEWQHAHACKKQIFTVILRDTDKMALPAVLGSIQSVNLSTTARPEDAKREFNRLRKQLRRPLIDYVVFALAAAAAIIALLFYWVGRPPNPPNRSDFHSVGGPSTTPLAVLEMALADNGELWYITQENRQYTLYKVDTKQAASGSVSPVEVTDLPAPDPRYPDSYIQDMIVDCNGKVWIALNAIGVWVYPDKFGPIQRREVAEWQSTRITTRSLASRCSGSETEIWFGGDGLRTLVYTGNNLSSIRYLPYNRAIDPAPNDTIADLALAQGRLWMRLETRPTVLAATMAGQIDTDTVDLGNSEPVLALNIDAQGNIIVGSGDRAARIDHSGQVTSLPLRAGDDALAIASDANWFWVGNECASSSPNCDALVVYHPRLISPVSIGVNVIHNILIDKSGVVWFATNQGLVYYITSP